MVGQKVDHHHAKTGTRSDERDIAVHLDQLETEIARLALQRRERALLERVAERELTGVMPEVRAVVADCLRIAGDKSAVRGQRQRVDLQKFQVLAPGDLGQARGIAREPRGDIVREHGLERGIEHIRPQRHQRIDWNTCEVPYPLHLLAALRRDQQFEALTRPVDADGEIYLLRDLDRFLNEDRGVGERQFGSDQPTRIFQRSEIGKTPDQPALATAALQHLRLKHVPAPRRHLGRDGIARVQQRRTRHRKTMAC